MTPAEWHATAMRLADALAELSAAQADDCTPAPRPTDAEIDAARAALSLHLLAYPVGKPVAWGLFAKVEDGGWTLQHPVRFTEEDAKSDRSMYERTTLLDVRPLYRNPKESA